MNDVIRPLQLMIDESSPFSDGDGDTSLTLNISLPDPLTLGLVLSEEQDAYDSLSRLVSNDEILKVKEHFDDGVNRDEIALDQLGQVLKEHVSVLTGGHVEAFVSRLHFKDLDKALTEGYLTKERLKQLKAKYESLNQLENTSLYRFLYIKDLNYNGEDYDNENYSIEYKNGDILPSDKPNTLPFVTIIKLPTESNLRAIIKPKAKRFKGNNQEELLEEMQKNIFQLSQLIYKNNFPIESDWNILEKYFTKSRRYSIWEVIDNAVNEYRENYIKKKL